MATWKISGYQARWWAPVLHFDNAPEDGQGDEEGRGFVDHEIDLIRTRLQQILDEDSDNASKADAMLGLF